MKLALPFLVLLFLTSCQIPLGQRTALRIRVEIVSTEPHGDIIEDSLFPSHSSKAAWHTATLLGEDSPHNPNRKPWRGGRRK